MPARECAARGDPRGMPTNGPAGAQNRGTIRAANWIGDPFENPFRRRCAWAPGRRAAAPRTQVLVELGPRDAEASTRELPVLPLLRCGIQQPRIPGERNADHAAIGEVGTETVFVESNVDDPLARSRFHDVSTRPRAESARSFGSAPGSSRRCDRSYRSRALTRFSNAAEIRISGARRVWTGRALCPSSSSSAVRSDPRARRALRGYRRAAGPSP